MLRLVTIIRMLTSLTPMASLSVAIVDGKEACPFPPTSPLAFRASPLLYSRYKRLCSPGWPYCATRLDRCLDHIIHIGVCLHPLDQSTSHISNPVGADSECDSAV